MRSRHRYPIVPIALLLGVLTGAAACERKVAHCSASTPREPESARLLTGGSTTLLSPIAAIGKLYSALHAGVSLTHQASSTGKGIERLLAGEIDLARASRPLSDAELEAAERAGKGLRTFLVGFDGIALIVHPDVFRRLRAMTRTQAREIFFEGTIADWSALSPDLSGPIHVCVRRSKRSGTASTFNRMVAGGPSVPYVGTAKEISGSSATIETVARDPAAIAYDALGLVDDRVRVLAFGEEERPAVVPDRASILEDRYLLRRRIFLITPSPIPPPVARFVHFVLGPEGQGALEEAGFVPLR